MLSGDPDAQDKLVPRYPDWMTIANYLRTGRPRNIPNYVAVNPVDRYDNFTIAGPTYLGPSYEAFEVLGDPSRPEFHVPNIGLSDDTQKQRLRNRVDVRTALDRMRRDIDQSGMMDAIDRFDSQAINLLTSPAARQAFELKHEPDAVRDCYGRHQWGQQCLLARRLVEAGVEIVTTEFDGPLCGRVSNWDDHAVNHHVFDALAYRAPFVDQAISALIEDIYQRGLDKRLLVIVTGEFGRTPRISHVASSGQVDALLGHVDRLLKRLENALSYARNHQDAQRKLLKNVPRTQWEVAVMGFEARVESEFARRRRELESDTGWQELRFASRSVRGPPQDSLGALVWAALREFDTDPRTSLRAESALY
jgi:hypothetical protein